MGSFKVIFQLFVMLGLSISIVQCSSSSGTSSGSGGGSTAPQFTTIDQLPKASDPVTSSGSSLVDGDALFATTGVTLKNMSSSSFTTSSSQAMCEAANTLKSSFNEAVQSSVILCYIQQVISDNDLGEVDIYDGQARVFTLDFGDSEDQGPGAVKIKLTKTDGVITDFEMWSCGDSGQSGQTEYMHQQIDGSDFTMDSKYTWDDTNGSGAQSISVTGALNSSGQFTSKTITSSYTSTWGDTNDTSYGGKTVTQGASQATISMWDTGTWTYNNQQESFTNRVYGIAELLNTSAIATIAIGDGAAVGQGTGTFNGGESYEWSFTEGWNGDTTAQDSESDFIATAQEGTIPDAGSEPSISFSGDEVFDCDTTGAISLTVDMDSLNAACSDLELGWEWVNCWDITGGDDQ